MGRFLLREGRMTEDEYQQALHVAVDRRLALEEVFVELGLVEHGELLGLERAQKREALIAAFAWGSGSWEFKDGEAPTESAFQLNPSTLVLDGVQRGFPSDKLEKRYTSRGSHLLRTGPRFQAYLTLFAPFLYRTGLHAAVGGETSVGAALGASGGDRTQALALLRTLELLRVVEVGAPADSASPAAQQHAPAAGAQASRPTHEREVAESRPPAPIRPEPKISLDDLPDAEPTRPGAAPEGTLSLEDDDGSDDAPAVLPSAPRAERSRAEPSMASLPSAPPQRAPESPRDTLRHGEEAVDTRRLWQELSGLRGADHYAILGVDDQANDAELRAALLEKLARWRPDRPGLTGELARPCADMTARIAAAYGALADPELRRYYDARRRGEPLPEPASARPAASQPQGHAPAQAAPPPRAQQQAPEDQTAMYVREGKAALERRDYATALHAFDEAKKTRPDDAELHVLSGIARYRNNTRDPNNIQEAVRDIMRSTELDESDVAYFHLGLIYKEQGLAHKAKQMFGRAVSLNPANTEARRALEALGGVAA